MCSTQDPIHGLQKYIEDQLKQLDKEAKVKVDLLRRPRLAHEPELKGLWTCILVIDAKIPPLDHGRFSLAVFCLPLL